MLENEAAFVAFDASAEYSVSTETVWANPFLVRPKRHILHYN